MFKFLRWSLIIIITWDIWTIDQIFIVIITFQLICPSASSSVLCPIAGDHTKSLTKPFIWTTGVDCFNSVNHDQVELLKLQLILRKKKKKVIEILGPKNSQWIVWQGHIAQWIRHLVGKYFWVKSSGGCRFNPNNR